MEQRDVLVHASLDYSALGLEAVPDAVRSDDEGRARAGCFVPVARPDGLPGSSRGERTNNLMEEFVNR